jgi:outer membrane protein assembly factor BamB
MSRMGRPRAAISTVSIPTAQSLGGSISTGKRTAHPCFGEDGTIYVGSANYLNAVRPDGTLLWRFPTFYPVQGHVSRSNNRLFFGSLDYAFRCVNLTGQLQWSFITRGYIDGGPALADDRVYFVNWDGRLYACSSAGIIYWNISIGSRTGSPAVGADGTIYVMGNGGWGILAINPANGLTRWRYSPSFGNPRCSPAIGGDGTVYVLDGNGRLYAFGPMSGFLMGRN